MLSSMVFCIGTVENITIKVFDLGNFVRKTLKKYVLYNTDNENGRIITLSHSYNRTNNCLIVKIERKFERITVIWITVKKRLLVC